MAKILRRHRLPNITPLPSFEDTPINPSYLAGRYKGYAYDVYGLGKPPSIIDRIKRSIQRSTNLSGTDTTGSVTDKLKEYLTPLVDVSSISSIIKMAGNKLPLIIGIAAMAGIIYLTYKIWDAHQKGDLAKAQKEISNAYNEIMSDLKSRAKDLFQIPGWVESIGDRVKDALHLDNPSSTISTLADIIHDVVTQQKTMAPVQGSGLLRNIYRKHANVSNIVNHTKARRGRGAMMPIY